MHFFFSSSHSRQQQEEDGKRERRGSERLSFFPLVSFSLAESAICPTIHKAFPRIQHSRIMRRRRKKRDFVRHRFFLTKTRTVGLGRAERIGKKPREKERRRRKTSFFFSFCRFFPSARARRSSVHIRTSPTGEFLPIVSSLDGNERQKKRFGSVDSHVIRRIVLLQKLICSKRN